MPKLFFGHATGSNLLFPFSVGATAALCPERCVTETLFEKIEAFRPTILVNVPTMVNHLVAHAESGGKPADTLATDLQAWAKARLEPYKYPRAVRCMADLPRTHLGKIDHGKLAARGR